MQVITVPNILEPTKSFKTEHDYTSVIDYLQFQYPDGFKVPHVIYLNDKRLEVADYDKACGRDDYIVIAFSPAVAAALGLTGVWAILTNLAVATAVSYVIGEIFKPDIPKGVLTSDQKTDAANVSSVYNLSSGQNRVGLGQPIPSLYGRTRVYPSLVEQPYFRFQDNDMYLYQMMAISVGNVAIEELFVSESKETDLAPNDILSSTYRNDSFNAGVIKSNISTTFNDDNYHMRVKTLPEISSLEIRGEQTDLPVNVSLENQQIAFYSFNNGDITDISSLAGGGTIEIKDTDNNDGLYNVSGTSGNIVNVSSKVDDGAWTSFIKEPSSASDSMVYALDDDAGRSVFYSLAGSLNNEYFVNQVIIISGTEYRVYLYYSDESSFEIRVKPIASGLIIDQSYDVYAISTSCTATLKTSYGSYTLEETPSELDSIEIDVEYPRGIYNSDSNGVFIDRTILLEYKLIGSIETLWIDLNDNGETWTEKEKTNTPQRRTYKLPIPSGLTDNTPLKLRLRRSSEETDDIKSQDQAIVTRIKSIYNEPDINDYGDITLLWVRAKATNAISSAGQFQINAWVNRIDVEHDLTSVITDIYTNTEYGAGLPLSDLDLPDVRKIINDTGFIQTVSTYYKLFGDGFYYLLDGGAQIVKSATPLIIGQEYQGGNPDRYYVINEAAPILDVEYPIRRYEYSTAEFNGALDSKITVMDAIRMIGKAGRYTVYLDGQNVKMRKDEIQLIRTALFNETNILKNSFKLDYLFGEDDGYDGMSVKYRDPVNFKEAIATYPSSAINPQVTELIGCTDFDIALKEATYGWRQKESRRKVATFSTDIQGIIPNYLDRIGITHNVPDWGLGGQIEVVDGNHITINCQLFRFSNELGKCDNEFGNCSDIFCEIEPENINYNTIIFRKNDGSVSDLYTFSIVDEYNILLNETPPAWLYTGYDYDNTFFSIGESNTFIKDYIVTEISPRGNNVVDVKCINYDDSVYEAPYLVDGDGDNLTDGFGNYLTV